MRTCARCNGLLPAPKPGPGRPRLFCASCSSLGKKTCRKCGVEFMGPKGRFYCTPSCRARAKQSRKEKRQREQHAKAEPVVYFIRSEHGGPIKIGIAANPEGRRRELQTGNPHRLTVVKTFPGGEGAEKFLHAVFADARLTGEWFEPVPELLALIGLSPFV